MHDRFAMRITARVLLASSLLGAGVVATAAGTSLPESREYKMMLVPENFGGTDPAKIVADFWERTLKPIIAAKLDKRDNGKPRHKGSFDESKQREVVFRDTSDCILNKHGYVLRERVKIKNDKPNPDSREATLKFRSPDLIVAAGARPDKGKAKFEEDITPLVVVRTVNGTETAAFAQPPSTRSLFSVSLDHDLEPADKLASIADAAALYPDLKKRLELAGASSVDTSAELTKGKTFRELVLEGALVDLGGKVDAELGISLWYEGTIGATAPSIAELSFKYAAVDNENAAIQVARRALDLFKGLQDGVKWANPEGETKTAAALPKACQRD